MELVVTKAIRGWCNLYQMGIILLLDYDGTLVPFEISPQAAIPSSGLVNLLRELVNVSTIKVFIVSGRSIEELQELLPISGLGFVGLHGMQIKYREKSWVWERAAKIKPILLEAMQEIKKEFSNEKGILLEDKGFTLAFHYRMVEVSNVQDIRKRFFNVVRSLSKSSVFAHSVEVIDGAMVFELRPDGWNKGCAVQKILTSTEYHCKSLKGVCIPIYIGDDVTDEDAFAVINKFPSGITIRVDSSGNSVSACSGEFRGNSGVKPILQRLQSITNGVNSEFCSNGLRTGAQFYLKNHKEVIKFLNILRDSKGLE